MMHKWERYRDWFACKTCGAWKRRYGEQTECPGEFKVQKPPHSYDLDQQQAEAHMRELEKLDTAPTPERKQKVREMVKKITGA